MMKTEMHAKTCWSVDYDSTINIEDIIVFAYENKERGIVFADKDTIIAFPKIEKAYKKLCSEEEGYKDFKIGYGVEISTIIDDAKCNVIILVKNQDGLKNLYHIMTLYFTEYNKCIPFDEIQKNKEGLLLGLIYNSEVNVNLDYFDYIEVNENTKIVKEMVIYSNKPNALYPGEIQAKEVLKLWNHDQTEIDNRLYLDTEDTLKLCDNYDYVVNNPNKILDMLDNIVINDGTFKMKHSSNFKAFESSVRKTFKEKFKNPSELTIKRLDKELALIKELDYTYYFEVLLKLTNFMKSKHEYYQLNGYINNLLVAYTLGITEVEPFKLPYELFFAITPSIEFVIGPYFFKKEVRQFLSKTFGSEIIGNKRMVRWSNEYLNYYIHKYAKLNNLKVTLELQDYIFSIISNMRVNKNAYSFRYFLLPNKDIIPIEKKDKYDRDINLVTHYDSNDLINNYLSISFVTSDAISELTKLRTLSGDDVVFCNDLDVLKLFRSTEGLSKEFKHLKRTTGLGFTKFNDLDENTFKYTRNLWLEDVVNHYIKDGGIYKDDLYNSLAKEGYDDVDIFRMLKITENYEKLYSKASFINRARVVYQQLYYKLKYHEYFYQVKIESIDFSYIRDCVFEYDKDMVIKRYEELSNSDLSLAFDYEEYKLLSILVEMYERGIEYLL